MGGLAWLAAATVAAAQAELALDADWDPAALVNIPTLDKPDKPVDMIVWTDTEPAPDDTWVYVCGFLSNQYNTKVLAVVRYWIEDPRSTDPYFAPVLQVYPSDWTTTTLDHVPKAMAVDDLGNVFIAAEVETASNGTDFATFKYTSALTLDTEWGSNGILTFDGTAHGDDTPADIQTYGNAETSSQRIFVTGTSLHGSGEGKNIVTRSYYGVYTGGWLEWSTDYDHDGGNDYAVELTAMAVDIPAGGSGFSPLVAGTVREDGEFDLFAMRLHAGTGNVAWAGTYTDPDGTDDECTGLAHNTVVNGVNSAPAIIAICGQIGTAASNDSVYLTWALNWSDGSEYWDQVGTYARGRAWEVDSTEFGFDTPVDISYGPGPSETTWVWVTGHGTDGTTLKIGTVAYELTDTDGDLAAEHVFYDPDDEDEDDYAVRLQVFQGDQPPVVFITGSTESASALPAYLTLHLEGDPLGVEAFAHYYGADLLNRTGTCWLDPVSGALMVTGWSGRSATGLDWATLRYNP